MGKLKNLKKLEKLKPYALQLNIQPKRLLAITSELAKVQYYINVLVKPIKVPFKGFECPFKGFERTFRGFEQTFQST